MARVEQVVVSSTAAYQVTGTDGTTVTVQNLGPDSCFYATASTVSSGSNDGTLTSGSSLSFVPSKFFISSGTSKLAVSTTASDPDRTWRNLFTPGARYDALAAGTYVLGWGLAGSFAGANAALALLYIDPADYGGGAVMRLKSAIGTNATAPTCDFTLGLYPVTPAGGGAAVVAMTAGTVTAGSTAVVTAPTLSTLNVATSTEFAVPTAGYYIIGVVVGGGGMAASSAVANRGILQVRRA